MGRDDAPGAGDVLVPAGFRLRKRHFGARPVSGLSPLPDVRGGSSPSSDRPPFVIRHADESVRLTAEIRELQDSDRLEARVSCSDPAMLGKGFVSVGLYGPNEGQFLGKTISLNVPEEHGCSGSADFGKFSDVVGRLGSELGVVIFLMT